MKDSKELALIAELMDSLAEEMSYGKEDLARRLGRQSEESMGEPEVKVVKLEAEGPMEKESEDEDEDEIEMDKEDFKEEHGRLIKTLRSPGRMDDLEEAEEQEAEMEEELGPDEMLKQRLMKLRG